ncbi:MAG: PAS domain S-box protein, partial [Magnetospirillum sp.]|nr:PAS domain S-box protein [Magnetospirillum sp.]
MLLVLVTLVPMLLWAAGLTLWSSLQGRQTMERGQSETVRALTIAVDQEIRLTVAALDGAALSHQLVNDDVAAFSDVARRLGAIHPEWNNVAVFDPAGNQVFNTLRPFGMALPSLSEPGYEEAAKAVRTVLETGQPAASNLFRSLVSGANVVMVAVPVHNRVGVLSHVLAASIRAERLGILLGGQNLPHGWFAAITDGIGVVIARVPGHDQATGQSVPEWFRTAVATTPHGTADGLSMTGDKVTASYERSKLTGWSISFGANRSLFHANLRDSLAVTAGFGALVLGGSLLLAFAMARRILGPVQALTAAARPFIQDRTVQDSVFGIAELDALHQALDVLTGELAKTQQRFLTFFSAAPVMLFVQDEAERLIAVNDAWLRILGYQHDEVLGRNPWEFHTEASRAYGEAVVWPEFLHQGQMDAVWGEILTKSGEVREVLVALRADYDEGGRILRTIGAVQDVTEQRQAEKALARAVKDAVRANDSKSRFLAAASHDLRQPLQALSLYLGVLKARLNGREDQVMEAVGQCIESLSGLLNDMLDVARLDAGVIIPKLAEVPASRLLERVAAAWRIQAEAKGVELKVVSSDRMVLSDPALMDRVLSNLVGNAVRYTEQGRILVGCRAAGPNHVRMEVWDTGIGIPA